MDPFIYERFNQENGLNGIIQKIREVGDITSDILVYSSSVYQNQIPDNILSASTSTFTTDNFPFSWILFYFPGRKLYLKSYRKPHRKNEGYTVIKYKRYGKQTM